MVDLGSIARTPRVNVDASGVPLQLIRQHSAYIQSEQPEVIEAKLSPPEVEDYDATPLSVPYEVRPSSSRVVICKVYNSSDGFGVLKVSKSSPIIPLRLQVQDDVDATKRGQMFGTGQRN